jgi:hypothetical protein
LKATKESGNDHAADRGVDGQRPMAAVSRFSLDHLPFDFQPDDEKEDGHQCLVHPVPRSIARDQDPRRSSNTVAHKRS